MEPIDFNTLFTTCNTIVNSEIKEHCDAILEKLNTLLPMTNKKGQKKNLKRMKKKVKKVSKFAEKV